MQVEDWRTVTETPKAGHEVSQRSRHAARTYHRRDSFWSLVNADSARGRKFARVVINEAAMVKDLHYTWTAVIRPTLIDLEGDALASTPKRPLTNYYRIWAGGRTMTSGHAGITPAGQTLTSNRRRLTPSGPNCPIG